MKTFSSHGTGEDYKKKDFAFLGKNVIFERGVRVFHPENIEIENHVYIGHDTILKGYYKNRMLIGTGTWIGQGCFFHSAGGLYIGGAVGIAPHVRILTSFHNLKGLPSLGAVMEGKILFSSVTISYGADIGIGAIILPGVRIGIGAVIGAGSVVTKVVGDHEIWAGNPAKFLRKR